MISCQRVAKTYIVRERAGLFRRGARRQIDALHGIDLTIAQGEFVGLLGRNGAGKSTLLKIVATLLLPSQGEVEVDGIDAVRALWLGTPAMFPLTLQFGLLGALAVAYVGLGWWALVYFERRARHHDLEGF